MTDDHKKRRLRKQLEQVRSEHGLTLSRQKEKILDTAIEIHEETAKEADEIGYIARALIMATLPHKDPKTHYYERVNGNFKLSVLSPPDIGIPYGVMPRLILIYLTQQCIITKKREIKLGDSLSQFMGELGLIPSGGRWGTITMLRKQIKRLFECRISYGYSDKYQDRGRHVDVAKQYDLFWDHKQPNQRTLWNSTVTLGEEIFEEIMAHKVPIDMRAIRALKSSSLALDIYQWSTWRVYRLNHGTLISWDGLMDQFGSDYAKNSQGKKNFKRKFKEQLGKVQAVYPKLDAYAGRQGLILSPSPTHIERSIPTRRRK